MRGEKDKPKKKRKTVSDEGLKALFPNHDVNRGALEILDRERPDQTHIQTQQTE